MSLVFDPDNDRYDGTRRWISANIQRETSAPTFRKLGTKLVKSFVPKVHTMFNLYQNMNKKGEDGDGRRESDVTGHDRFYQERPRSRRKRRSVSRRTQSAIELDSEAITTARAILRRGRSASIEDTESEDDKGSQLTNKIDSLAKLLFNRVSVAKACRENDTSMKYYSTMMLNFDNHREHIQQTEFQPEKYLRAIRSRARSRRATWNTNVSSSCNLYCPTYKLCFWHRTRNNCHELHEIQNYESSRETDENGNRNRGHQYTALDNGPPASEDVGEYMEMEKRTRDRALSICQNYIREKSRYNLIEQLNNVGSRVDKYWFAVRDTRLKTDRLLTLVPLNRNCSLNICPATKETLNSLFLALQHPYICPVLDLEFVDFKGQNYVILVQPMNQGSLKDLIYGIERNCWNEDWGQKYASRGKGLPLPQVQQMGRQILEALMFLKERGFPTVTHLHSGNVVVQNGVARLAGLENSLLGFTSRIHPVVTSRSPHLTTIDSICFGNSHMKYPTSHMLFEMCAGYELCSFKPASMHFTDLKMYPQVANLMHVIFSKTNGRYPSVEELLVHDLFRNIDLREMRSAPVTIFRPTLTPSIVNLLDGIKRHNSGKKYDRRESSSLDTEDMISLTSPELETTEEVSLLAEIYNELSNTTV